MKRFIIQFTCIFAAVALGTLLLNRQAYKDKNKIIEIKAIENVILNVNDNKLNLILNNNDTVKSFVNMLPVKGTMTNKDKEQLVLKLDEQIAHTPEKIDNVKKGDILLNKDNELIIILTDLTTKEEYTKLGTVLLIDKLEELKEKEEVKVSFNKR